MRDSGPRCSKMPCESCAVQFSVFRRKRACPECERLYCGACLRRGGGMCAPCRALSTRPLMRNSIAHLKVRDLQCFLQRQNVSTRGCVEKEELISLCMAHVNSASYRRHSRTPGAFSSLKGLTTNINDLLVSAFELRTAQPAPAPPPRAQPPSTYSSPDFTGSCYNSAHAHSGSGYSAPPPSRPERFNPTPGGERNIEVPLPSPPPPATAPPTPRVDTADCFEVEDVDDAGWEFVARPADPLPNDSEMLIQPAANDSPHDNSQSSPLTPPTSGATAARPASLDVSPQVVRPAPVASPPSPLPLQRAASALHLPQSPADDDDDTADSASLQDEPLSNEKCGEEAGGGSAAPGPLTLSRVRSWSQIASLSARQLKLLLARNRVEYRGCVERADLLQRARTLWTDHERNAAELESLPLEECCKICMAAPLECVLLECGHIAACVACARLLADCPICRQYVVRAVRCFRS